MTKEETKIRNKKYKQENKEKILAQQKIYYQENKEAISTKRNIYRQENKEKVTAQKKKYDKKYYQENTDKIKIYNKKYNQENKEKSKKYRQENKEKIAAYYKRHYQENKERINAHNRKYINSTPIIKLRTNIRCRVGNFLNNKGFKKKGRTEEILGANWKTVELFIEAKFVDGMNWDNKGEWHIDHIIPLSSAETEQEIIKLCHYTNLQPLWAFDNLSKGNSLDWVKE
jgi:hypothetical protein